MNYSYEINLISGEIETKSIDTETPYRNFTFVVFSPYRDDVLGDPMVYAESQNSPEEAKSLVYLECIERIDQLRTVLNHMEN